MFCVCRHGLGVGINCRLYIIEVLFWGWVGSNQAGLFPESFFYLYEQGTLMWFCYFYWKTIWARGR